ncbi:Serine/threonine-protein kinase PEPKR2 [Camellia lanceoleosa]|uniref:Serine/threonine-protein kinase PEPKR2 n=1 Tax=Camellia lanceoleosa TaxID=1840588 RepID=A0ACC0HG17_9ERIC|nr:Serine/threonine-protein kinase PEPKR2 [Camellia lanceoleosa]
MQHLSGHPGVVTLEAVYDDSKCFHLVMELCSSGHLIDQMASEGRYSKHRAANIFEEIVLVVKHCHEMEVVQRDIKPENILLTNSGKIKLADFSLAMRIVNGQRLTGLAGSPAYVAPEVLLGDFSERVDMWSAGVLHALLTGLLPFQVYSLEAVFEAIKNMKLDFHTGIWESISKAAQDLIERILTRDVATRITADEVLSKHPWILLYTDRTLRTLSIKSKSKSRSPPPPSQLPAFTTRLEEPNDCRTAYDSFGETTDPASLPGSLSRKTEEQDDSGLVDALAVAISHVTISKTKRSRLCIPTNPIQEQCSSKQLTDLHHQHHSSVIF